MNNKKYLYKLQLAVLLVLALACSSIKATTRIGPKCLVGARKEAKVAGGVGALRAGVAVAEVAAVEEVAAAGGAVEEVAGVAVAGGAVEEVAGVAGVAVAAVAAAGVAVAAVAGVVPGMVVVAVLGALVIETLEAGKALGEALGEALEVLSLIKLA